MYTFAYLGMQQIVIILVIALLIFGPQKVPELGRQIGGALRDLKKMSNDVQSAFDLDDHSSYDRYEPPTYEYTPPVSTTYGHESLDQYGLPVTPEHPAIEAADATVAGTEAAPELTPGLELSPTIVEAEAALPTETPVTQETPGTHESPVTHPPVETVLETETTPTVTGADADAKGA
jgi:TatA/E family protein of Tat protein translocase